MGRAPADGASDDGLIAWRNANWCRETLAAVTEARQRIAGTAVPADAPVSDLAALVWRAIPLLIDIESALRSLIHYAERQR